MSAGEHAGRQAIVRGYDFHPPCDLRLFPMPEAGVLRFDDEVFVAQVRYQPVPTRILRPVVADGLHLAIAKQLIVRCKSVGESSLRRSFCLDVAARLRVVRRPAPAADRPQL